MKNILFHINSIGRGGAERVASIILNHMAEEGYRITLVTLWKDSDEYEIDSRINRINLAGDTVGEGTPKGLASRVLTAFSRIFNLRKVIRSVNPDIVISFLYKANLRSALALAGKDIPLLISVRNDPAIDYVPHKYGKQFLEKAATACVFQTKDATEYFGKKLVNNSRIIFNPINEKFLVSPFKHSVKAEASDDFPYKLLAIGRLSPQKNHILAIEALGMIREEFPNTCLNIYGVETDSGEIPEVNEKIKECCLEGRVNLMGLSDRIDEIMADSDIFVLSSNYEGMPNALMEAMVTGLPCVSTDCPCGGPAMLIENGVSGVLTEVNNAEQMADAIRKLLRNPQLRTEISNNSQSIAEKVDPKNICKQWIEFVDEVIEMKR